MYSFIIIKLPDCEITWEVHNVLKVGVSFSIEEATYGANVLFFPSNVHSRNGGIHCQEQLFKLNRQIVA